MTLSQTIQQFQKTIFTYYHAHGRKLPWRCTKDPYRILVSEVMLQQTQVSRVLEKYSAFIRKFPTIQSLTRSSLHKVLRAWSGLGYNRRALLLHKTAKLITDRYRGKLPQNVDELKKLPGVGSATASAVCAFAFNQPVVFLETNIRSVFIHFFFGKRRAIRDSEILPIVERTLDRKHPREWYYALMDYGVILKKTQLNPSRRSAHHVRQTPFRGSRRELRGKILKLFLEHPRIKPHQAAALLEEKPRRIYDVFRELHKEGFI